MRILDSAGTGSSAGVNSLREISYLPHDLLVKREDSSLNEASFERSSQKPLQEGGAMLLSDEMLTAKQREEIDIQMGKKSSKILVETKDLNLGGDISRFNE